MKLIPFLLSCALVIPSAKSQSIILECGQNSGQNFNGWHLGPYNVFDDIEFDAQSVSFFSEFGGNYGVTLTRKIDELKEYPELNILFNFENYNKCEIDNVTYFTSTDGRTWERVTDYSFFSSFNHNNRAIKVFNDSLDIAYVRAVANTRFENNGKLTCNYVKIEGTGKEETSLKPISLIEDPTEKTFFIFSFKHTLNIETGIDFPYEVLITSMSGQIVYRERLEGSTRILLPEELSGVYVVSIIQDGAFQARKKVVLQ